MTTRPLTPPQQRLISPQTAPDVDAAAAGERDGEQSVWLRSGLVVS